MTTIETLNAPAFPSEDHLDAVMAEAVARKRSDGTYLAYLPAIAHVVTAEGADHVEALAGLRQAVAKAWLPVMMSLKIVTGKESF